MIKVIATESESDNKLRLKLKTKVTESESESESNTEIEPVAKGKRLKKDNIAERKRHRSWY